MFRRLFRRGEGGRRGRSMAGGFRGEDAIGRLCEGEPSLVVDFEDLLNGVDVGGCPKVQAQVVLGCCAHDLL